MIKLFLLSIAVLASVYTFAQEPSDCTVPPILQSEYETDVIQLAFSRMYDINSSDTSSIDIPLSYQDTIWHGLAAIFNCTSIPERDSVFDIYCVHRSPPYCTLSNLITVNVDTSYSWTDAWFNQITLTGYDELDSFIAQYGFELIRINDLNWADLSTDQIINTRAFCDSLEGFDGVISAHSARYGGDGNNITYSKIGDEQFYDFSIGWGDCMLGCIYRYTWRFKVNYDACSVEYLGSEAINESDFPEPTNCNITAINIPESTRSIDIKLYPNPATESITIEAKDIEQVDIFTITGKHVNKTQGSERSRVNLNGVPAGIYLVQVISKDGVATQKLIVE